MRLLRLISPFIVLFVVCQTLYSQQNPGSLLDSYMKTVREEATSPKAPEALYKTGQPAEMPDHLSTYYNDTMPEIRGKAFYLTYKLGSENSQVAGRCIENLTIGLKDKNTGIVDLVMNYLKMFRASDFPLSAKDTINALVERTTPHYKNLVKLAGFLQLEKSREILKRKLQTKDYASPGERWAILLSLSRMGEQKAIDFCLKIAKRAGVNDDFVYDIAPGFVYTRQKELTDYLVSLLYSEQKDCSSPNPESSGQIHCGYRLMELLAPVVRDFPLKTDVAGEIVTDDYEKALNKTRSWFKKYEDDYQLLGDTF